MYITKLLLRADQPAPGNKRMEPADSRQSRQIACLAQTAYLCSCKLGGHDRPEPIPVVSQTVSRVPAPAVVHAEPTPWSQKHAQNFHQSRDQTTILASLDRR